MDREGRIMRLEVQIAQMAKELATLKKPLLKEPEGNNPVVYYIRTFGREKYHYAAIKARGRWWTTGGATSSGRTYSWAELLRQIGSEDAKTLMVGVAWESLDE